MRIAGVKRGEVQTTHEKSLYERKFCECNVNVELLVRAKRHNGALAISENSQVVLPPDLTGGGGWRLGG